jgi:phospholipid/cholesterol/gamma-HCH transport system substrate-binding protein
MLVGGFVLLSLTVLATLAVWFGETPSWLGGNEWTLRVTNVPDLTGIGPGSPVTLGGVEIGRVKNLEFRDPKRPTAGVNIVCGINNLYSVPVGAFARVYGATFGLGAGRVDIVLERATPGVLLDHTHASIPGEMRSIVGEIISKDLIASVEKMITNIADLAEKTTPFAENLGRLTEPRPVTDVDQPDAAERGVTANLATAVERFDRLVANVNTILGDQDVQSEVKTAIADLTTASRELRDTVDLWQRESQRISDNLNAGVDRTEENLDVSFAKLNRGLDSLDAAAGGLARILHQVEDGRGTAGRLVRDERLYEAGVITLQRLSELIATLQRIVGKAEQDGYIKVGQATAVGTLTIDMPTGEFAARVIEKFSAAPPAAGGPVARGAP